MKQKKLQLRVFFTFQLLFIILLAFSPSRTLALGCFETNSACTSYCGPQGCSTHTDPVTGTTSYCCEDFTGVNIARDFNIGQWTLLSRPGYESFSSFLSSLLPNVYIIAGVILLFLTIGSGFAIMNSTNDPQKKSQGSKALTAAIVGFLILFSSYWLIQIIQKITGIPILDTTKIPF
jgi:branched-subunit amino acid transport protein AzlD